MVSVRSRWQERVPVRLVLEHLLVQSRYECRAETFCLADSLWVVHGSGDIIQLESATYLHKELCHELRAAVGK